MFWVKKSLKVIWSRTRRPKRLKACIPHWLQQLEIHLADDWSVSGLVILTLLPIGQVGPCDFMPTADWIVWVLWSLRHTPFMLMKVPWWMYQFVKVCFVTYSTMYRLTCYWPVTTSGWEGDRAQGALWYTGVGRTHRALPLYCVKTWLDFVRPRLLSNADELWNIVHAFSLAVASLKQS